MNDNDILKFIECELRSSASEDVGLCRGMISECVFYYLMGRVYDEQNYTDTADTKIDRVFEIISNDSIELDFKNGLTGIGWVIEHLVQLDFLEGDTNDILEDMDDRLFKYLSFNSSSIQKIDELLGYGFYVTKRLSNTKNKKNPESISILNNLLILIVNMISECLDQGYKIISEPISFLSTWSLPLLLILLKEVLILNIYNQKIENIIIHQLFPSFLTFIPRQNVIRFYLLLALNQLNDLLRIKELDYHVQMLQANFDQEKIISSDFREMDIMVMDGAAGLFLLMNYCFKCNKITKDLILSEQCINKIIKSKYWDIVKKEDSLCRDDRSFLFGICGLGIVLLSNKLNY